MPGAVALLGGGLTGVMVLCIVMATSGRGPQGQAPGLADPYSPNGVEGMICELSL